MSSKTVRAQRIESIIIMLSDYLVEERPENGGRTVVTECISLLKGKLEGLKK